MAKKDDDYEGALHDGQAYAVDLINGKTIRMCDFDRSLESILARQPDERGYVVFTGAREALEDEDGKQEIQKIDGAGGIKATLIAGIRNWGPAVYAAQDAASETARALFEAQATALRDQVADQQAPGKRGGDDILG